MSNLAEFENLVLQLPEPERWQLATRLLESLPPSKEPWSDQEILDEALRRDAEMDRDPSMILSESQFWAGVQP
jgi:hypothetical protein